MHRTEPTFDLSELTSRAGVSARTVRYYIQQGLLSAPETRGPGPHYSTDHLNRLLLIRRLQKEHLPLAEIRRRLEELSADEIARLVSEPVEPPPSDAMEYIRSALSDGAASLERKESYRRPSSSELMSETAAFHTSEQSILRLNEVQLPSSPPPLPTRRSRWDRIELTPDVELHVRRPLTREQNRQLERLLEAARHIFDEY